jgi:hypothetical protein
MTVIRFRLGPLASVLHPHLDLHVACITLGIWVDYTHYTSIFNNSSVIHNMLNEIIPVGAKGVFVHAWSRTGLVDARISGNATPFQYIVTAVRGLCFRKSGHTTRTVHGGREGVREWPDHLHALRAWSSSAALRRMGILAAGGWRAPQIREGASMLHCLSALPAGTRLYQHHRFTA